MDNFDLQIFETAMGGMALACVVLILITLLGCIETVQQLIDRQKRKNKRTETEKRLGRERL